MRFSPRLKAILSFVEGRTLADIGTDHGYIPIAACLEGLVKRAVACDLCPGPTEQARENIKNNGLEDRIEVRVGYGLQPVSKDECDCVVIAGMGGMNIAEILNDSAAKAQILSIRQLIVQPQRDILLVKDVINNLGFEISDIVEVTDRGRPYTIISAIYSGLSINPIPKF